MKYKIIIELVEDSIDPIIEKIYEQTFFTVDEYEARTDIKELIKTINER